MDGTFLLITSLGGNAVFITISVFVIKSLVKSIVKGETKVINERIAGIQHNCTTVSTNIIKAVNGNKEESSEAIKNEKKARVKTDDEFWSAFHSHGHQGLKGEDGKVTRT